MGATEFGVNHPLAVKLWSKRLFYETLKETWIGKFTGTSSNSLIHIQKELKQVGDKLTYGLRMLLTGDGVQGDETLEGKEEALVFHPDSILINQLRHATRSSGKMSEQRVPYGIREESRQALTDWLADKIDTGFFNQIAGMSGVTDTKLTGNNATVAPSNDHWLLATGVAGTDAETSLSASSVFSLTLLDKAVVMAKVLSPGVRPIRVNGENKYVCFIHPYQHYQLRMNTNTAQYMDIQKAALQGGQISKNPIYTGAIAEYNGVVLHEATRVPNPSGYVRRAVFGGAQSAVMSFGRDTASETAANWVEELFDYKNQLGVAAGLIYGLKKCIFNSKDFGCITISTYSPAP